MTDFAVRIHALSKFYRRYNSAGSRIVDFGNFLLRGRRSQRFYTPVYVLNNINLTIGQGRALGIVGQNGSGKSTLLKMIAGVLPYSTGKIKTHGRIASIIELGAGFAGDDTGLQNIHSYLAIYSIDARVKESKIESIIDFSGLGIKINDPVKSYSSGMVVRLAFAIIANLDADILLVDEALSVGDAVFAQKCMRFIKEFIKRGTLVFVSHDMNALQNLCDTVIWIHDGEIRQKGDPKQVCQAYLEYTLSTDYPEHSKASKEVSENSEEVILSVSEVSAPETQASLLGSVDLTQGFGGQRVEIEDIRLSKTQESDLNSNLFAGGDELSLIVDILAKDEILDPIIGFLVKNERGIEIFGENTLYIEVGMLKNLVEGRRYSCTFKFTLPLLPSGDYTITSTVAQGDFHQHQQLVWRHDALVMRIVSERFRYGMVGLPGSEIIIRERG